ncbi:ROK family protein [Kitasatospora sp. NPDC006697]|uniref:ROK family protein n=1 Tax=Kitasatospora sp. NPDC006697 TaxID=3364020 RepID=UPI003687BC7D
MRWARVVRSAGGAAQQAASQQGMRRQNLALVLRTVADHGPLSRAEVAARTGLTRAAVSSLVTELTEPAVLGEAEPEPTGRVGRPGAALTVSERGPAGIGLEIGVGHLAACAVDLCGRVRAERRSEGANRGRPSGEVLAELAGLAAAVAEQVAADGLRPVGLGVAVPGLVGGRPGAVQHAPNLDWREVPVRELISPQLDCGLAGLEIVLENEANLGALAELRAGAGSPDMVHLSAEAGIGAALLVEGRLFRGARGFAGELGHMPVHPEGRRCACGARGCLERYAGLAEVLRAAGVDDRAGGDGVALLAERAGAGDEAALAALDGAGRALGIALAGAVNLMDPAAVVLGGAYAQLAGWLLPPVAAELAERVTVRPWEPGALRGSALGRTGPLLGAALLTVDRIMNDPASLAR